MSPIRLCPGEASKSSFVKAADMSDGWQINFITMSSKGPSIPSTHCYELVTLLQSGDGPSIQPEIMRIEQGVVLLFL